MRFNINIKSLWLDLRKRWVVDSGDGLRRAQMMKVGGQVGELSPGSLLAAFLLLHQRTALELVEVLAHLLVLLLNMQKVVLASVEIVFVLT